MFFSVTRDFSGLGFGDIAGIDSHRRFALFVNRKHEVEGLGLALMEELNKHQNHVLHRRVVIVVKDDFVHARDAGLLSLFKFGVTAMPRRARRALREAHQYVEIIEGRIGDGKEQLVSDTLNRSHVSQVS